MRKLALFFETERGKRVKNVIIGCGASVVLIGALFKLQHWPFAGELLIVGMSVEAFIFALQGILPPHKDYYWEKIYPELDVSPEVEEMAKGHHHGKDKKGGTITQQLDEMLEAAKVESDVIQRLGKNLQTLNNNVERMGELGDSVVSTKEYAEKTKAATSLLGEMTNAYSSATESAKMLAASTSETKNYHEQVQQITKNLSALNSMYELELQDASNHLKAMNKFYGSLSEAMNNMNASVEDSRTYQQELNKLTKNLVSLNSVYGSMISAMRGPQG